MNWKRMSQNRKRDLILSLFDDAECLTVYDMVEKMKQRGVNPPSPKSLAFWIRNYMKYKYFECQRDSLTGRQIWMRRPS